MRASFALHFVFFTHKHFCFYYNKNRIIFLIFTVRVFVSFARFFFLAHKSFQLYLNREYLCVYVPTYMHNTICEQLNGF